MLGAGTLEMRDRDAAAQSPLAARLFDITGVTGVFLGSDFIAVSKGEEDWQVLKPAILGAIMEHYMSGAPLLAGEMSEATTTRTSSSRRRTPTRSRPSRN